MNEKEGEIYHDGSALSSITTTATIIDSNLSCHGNLYGKNVGQYVPMDIFEKLFSAIGNYLLTTTASTQSIYKR